MMPQPTDRSLLEEMPAAEPARAALGQVPVRMALAQQGLAWAVLPQAGPARAGGRRAEPARVALGQVAGALGQPARAASGQAVPLRAGAGGQAVPVLVVSGPVESVRLGLAPEEPPQVDPVIP